MDKLLENLIAKYSIFKCINKKCVKFFSLPILGFILLPPTARVPNLLANYFFSRFIGITKKRSENNPTHHCRCKTKAK